MPKNCGGTEGKKCLNRIMAMVSESRRQSCAHMYCSKRAHDNMNEKGMVMMSRYEQDAAMFSYSGDARQRSTALK